MSRQRVQRILARAGISSRRKAEELIREGRVTVNGQVVEIGAQADPDVDAIKLDGRRVHLPEGNRYYLLSKPKGCVCTTDDPEGRRTVFEVMPKGLRKGLFSVGRLDFHSEGLLILTDDGDFAQKVAHPRYGCVKRYEAKVKGEPTPDVIEKLSRGIVLDGKRTLPADIQMVRKKSYTKKPLTQRGGKPGRGLRTERGGFPSSPPGSNSWIQISIQEGRTRQIREMFYRMGHPVQRLRRVAIGGLRDPKLAPGTYRELTPDEIERLLSASRKRSKPLGGRTKKPFAGATRQSAAGKSRSAVGRPSKRRSEKSRPKKSPSSKNPASKSPTSRGTSTGGRNAGGSKSSSGPKNSGGTRGSGSRTGKPKRTRK